MTQPDGEGSTTNLAANQVQHTTNLKLSFPGIVVRNLRRKFDPGHTREFLFWTKQQKHSNLIRFVYTEIHTDLVYVFTKKKQNNWNKSSEDRDRESLSQWRDSWGPINF